MDSALSSKDSEFLKVNCVLQSLEKLRKNPRPGSHHLRF